MIGTQKTALGKPLDPMEAELLEEARGEWSRALPREGRIQEHDDPDSGFEIQEFGTERYSSLEDAQRAALPHLAELLAYIVRQGIEKGRFVVVNGVVEPVYRWDSEETADGGFTNDKNVV
jgi:hypothetical protein